ncbi:MAG: iron ABC transporter permease [Actinomycetota bacterium]|nr:iron ABC transporter permease [Actinomycetota bacterium]
MTTTAIAEPQIQVHHKSRWVIPMLAVALGLAIVTSGLLGALPIPLAEFLPSLFGKGTSTSGQLQHEVLWQIRLPRVALAILIGACLATAGVIMQGVFANPLAEPGLVGVSSGAAVGAVAAIVLGATAIGFWVLPLAAFVGGLLVTAAVYFLARFQGRSEVLTLLLTGIAVNAMAGAIIGLLMSVSDDAQLRSITFWNLGSLSAATWTAVLTVLPVAVLGALAIPILARPLDLLSLGERNAQFLGLNVNRNRQLAIIVTALLTAAAVAVAGIIAFVGLVIPHAMRLVVGPSHMRLLISSALAGSLLIVVADLISRTVAAPREIPLGVITGLIGAPAFFYLLRREHGRRGAWA